MWFIWLIKLIIKCNFRFRIWAWRCPRLRNPRASTPVEVRAWVLDRVMILSMEFLIHAMLAGDRQCPVKRNAWSTSIQVQENTFRRKRVSLMLTMRQSTSKLHSFYLSNGYFCRFGTSVRKEPKRPDWPGPFDTERPSYTTGGRTEHSKWDSSQRQILNAKKLKELRSKLDAKGDSLGPG